MKKLFLAILVILMALSLKSTEVYVCGWWTQEYDCRMIGDQPQETKSDWDPYIPSNSDELQDEHFLLPIDLNN